MTEAYEIERFQSLDLKAVPWTRWLWSFAIHAGALLILIAIPVTVQRVVQPPDRVAVVRLVAPSAPPSPPARPVPKPLKPLPVIKVRPRVPFEAPPVKKLLVKTIVPPLPPADIPKPIETVRIETPKIDLPTRPLVKQDVFPANSATPVSQDASRQVKTAGFGDPNGVPSASSPTHGLTVQRLGSFDASAGQGYEPGGGSRKAVAMAGFGSAEGVTGGAGKGASGSGKGVARAGFGDEAPVSAVSAVRPAAAGTETPVEITFKPKPAYTAEAREKKIEGEVQLDVLFSSTGEVHVLRVVRGLGFGLDENARVAAGQIRFHPATRGGSPVDVTGVVHIVFEIS